MESKNMKVNDLFIELEKEVLKLDSLYSKSYLESCRLPEVLLEAEDEIKRVRDDVINKLKEYEISLQICKSDVYEITNSIKKEMEKLDCARKILEYEGWENIDDKFKRLEEIEKVQLEVLKEKRSVEEVTLLKEKSKYFKEFFTTLSRRIEDSIRRVVEGKLEDCKQSLQTVTKNVNNTKVVYAIENELEMEMKSGSEVYSRCIKSMLEEMNSILLNTKISEEEKIRRIEKISKHMTPKFWFLKEEKLPLTNKGEVLPILPEPFYKIAIELEKSNLPLEYTYLLDKIKHEVELIENKIKEGTFGVCVLTTEKIKKVVSLYQNYESGLRRASSLRHDNGKFTFLGRFLYEIGTGISGFRLVTEQANVSQENEEVETVNMNEVRKKYIVPILQGIVEIEKKESMEKLISFKNILKLYRDLKKDSYPKKLLLSEQEKERYQHLKNKAKVLPHSGIYTAVIDFLNYITNSGIIMMVYDEKKSKGILEREGIRDDVSIDFLKKVCEILVD